MGIINPDKMNALINLTVQHRDAMYRAQKDADFMAFKFLERPWEVTTAKELSKDIDAETSNAYEIFRMLQEIVKEIEA